VIENGASAPFFFRVFNSRILLSEIVGTLCERSIATRKLLYIQLSAPDPVSNIYVAFHRNSNFFVAILSKRNLLIATLVEEWTKYIVS
jgi:hypothetical protein